MIVPIFLLVCFLSVSITKALDPQDIIPVLIIDTDNVLNATRAEINPFRKTSAKEFNETVARAAENSVTVVIFIEDKLSVEDVSGRDNVGASLFYIRQYFEEGKVQYLTAVENPYPTLQNQFHPLDINIFHLRTPETKLQLFENKKKYFYVFFEESGNETRVETLRRHDKIIKEVCFVVRQVAAGPIVAIYTGKTNPMNVPMKLNLFKPRSIPRGAFETDVLFFSTNTTLFKFTGMRYHTNGRRWAQNTPIGVAEDFNDRIIRSRLEFDGFQLEFNFMLNPQEWSLDEIVVMEEDEPVGSLRTSNIRAPWGYSYACHESLEIANKRDGSIITIPTYQIEPIQDWVKYGHDDKYLRSRIYFFRAVINCGPYFSSSIVMSLFVVGLLLLILFYGVVSLMNVLTNSKYDDPSGKQLFYCGDING